MACVPLKDGRELVEGQGQKHTFRDPSITKIEPAHTNRNLKGQNQYELLNVCKFYLTVIVRGYMEELSRRKGFSALNKCSRDLV